MIAVDEWFSLVCVEPYSNDVKEGAMLFKGSDCIFHRSQLKLYKSVFCLYDWTFARVCFSHRPHTFMIVAMSFSEYGGVAGIPEISRLGVGCCNRSFDCVNNLLITRSLRLGHMSHTIIVCIKYIVCIRYYKSLIYIDMMVALR